MSAQNTTLTSGNFVRLARYWLLMLPQPTIAIPNGSSLMPSSPFLRRRGHRRGEAVVREPAEALADSGEHVGGAAVEFDDVPFGGLRRREDLRDRHAAAADGGHRVVL